METREKPAPRDLGAILLVLGLVLAAAFASVPITEPDIGWHLAGGREIARSGLPSTNTFSFTWPDHPWQVVYWLFELVVYGLFSLGGFPALSAFQAAACAVAFLLPLATFRRMSLRTGAGPVGWAGLLSGGAVLYLALALSWPRFQPRPHLVSYLGLALLLFLWERKPRFLPLWAFLTGAVWANSHAGVVFGLIVCLLVVLASFAAREPGGLARAARFAGAFFAGSLCNPYFLGPYLYSFAAYWDLEAASTLMVQEFRHAPTDRFSAWLLFGVLAAAAVPFRLRKRDFLYPLLAGAFLLLSWRVVRLAPKFAIVVLPGLLLTLQEEAGELSRRGKKALAILLAAVFALFTAGMTARYELGRLLPPPGWGADLRYYPERAARFVDEKGLTGPMYNDFGQGGYLAWTFHPRRLVFQDSRGLAYPAAFWRDLFSRHQAQRWGEMLDRWGIQFALVERQEAFEGVMGFGVLFVKCGWIPVHLDGATIVFVRPGSENAARTADSAFSLLRVDADAPALLDLGLKCPGPLARELARIDPAGLIIEGDFNRFGVGAFGAGDLDLAERFFRSGLDLFPSSLSLRLNLASALAKGGRLEEARAEYREVAERGKGSGSKGAEPPEVQAARRRLAELQSR